MKKIITSLVILFLFIVQALLAQNIGINSTGAVANSSAGLDINFTNKGLLIPRVALTSLTDGVTITSPATSLLVYNNGTGGLNPAGYYYNSGTPASPAWVQLITQQTTSSACADGCNWTLVAVTNSTVFGSGVASTGYTVLTGKEYLAVLNDPGSFEVTAAVTDNVSVFEITTSNKTIPAGGSQMQVGMIDPIAGGTTTFGNVGMSAAKIKGRYMNGSATQLQISYANTTGDYIVIDGAGIIYLYDAGVSGDPYLYLFER